MSGKDGNISLHRLNARASKGGINCSLMRVLWVTRTVTFVTVGLLKRFDWSGNVVSATSLDRSPWPLALSPINPALHQPVIHSHFRSHSRLVGVALYIDGSGFSVLGHGMRFLRFGLGLGFRVWGLRFGV